MPIETSVAINDLADLPIPEAMESYEKERNAISDFAEENGRTDDEEPTKGQFNTLLDKLKQFSTTKEALGALQEMAHAEDTDGPQYTKQCRSGQDVKLIIMSDYDVHAEAHVGELDANLGNNGERLVITVNGVDARADISLCDGTNLVTIENFNAKQLVKVTKALMKLVDETDLDD